MPGTVWHPSRKESLIVDLLYRSAWNCHNSPLHQDFLPYKNHSTFQKPGTQNPTILPVRAGAAVKIRSLLYTAASGRCIIPSETQKVKISTELGPTLHADIMGQLINHATEWREPSRLKTYKQTILFEKICQRLWAVSISQVGQFKPGNIHREHSMKTNFPWTRYSFLAKLKTLLRPHLPNKIPALKGNEGSPRLRPEQSTEVCISEHTGRIPILTVSIF